MKLKHTWNTIHVKKILIRVKFLLKIATNLPPSKDSDKERVMHSKSNNIETMIFDETHEAIEERFESLLKSYQIGMSKVYRLLKGY